MARHPGRLVHHSDLLPINWTNDPSNLDDPSDLRDVSRTAPTTLSGGMGASGIGGGVEMWGGESPPNGVPQAGSQEMSTTERAWLPNSDLSLILILQHDEHVVVSCSSDFDILSRSKRLYVAIHKVKESQEELLALCCAMAAIHGQPSNNIFCEKKSEKKKQNKSK